MSDESARVSLLWETIQEKEDYPIFRLTYLSNPVAPFTDADFDDIESKSVEANNARDVTGILIADDDRILQILEGREDAVRELYAKIEADSRHVVIKLVCAVEDEVRLLLTWSMVVRKLTGTPPAVLEQFTEVYDELLHADSQCEISIEHVDLFKAIALFEALPQGVKW
ncbi:MAG: BLUF domain-containing protein [Akkermansiaceae bacterium]